METSLFNRVQATLLALATAALFLLAVLNLREERQFPAARRRRLVARGSRRRPASAEQVLPGQAGASSAPASSAATTC